MNPIRCPKCKSVDIFLEEHIDSVSCWYPGEERGYHNEGSYYKVMGICESCRHIWRLRNQIQMNAELKERLHLNAEILKTKGTI